MKEPLVDRLVLVPLGPAKERVERMLDGGTFNREKIGQDSLALIREVQYWRSRNADVVLNAT